MKTSATNRKLRLLLTGIQSGTLVPKPEFQRRLVWTTKHKLAFLRTVLEGYPFPEIYIAAGDVDSETGEGKELLVDGQQRITTLYQYFKGSEELKLDLEVAPYRNLSEDQKIQFLEYEVVIRDLGKLPLVEILEIFRRINSTNYALNAMEVHNARFEGAFKEFGDELARNPFFEQNRFFTTQEVRRMGDTKFCLTLVATFMAGYFNRDDALEKYLEAYNEEFSQRDALSSEFNAVSDFFTRCDFDSKSRVWKKADLFSLFVEIHRALFKRKISIAPEAASRKLKEFYLDVDSGANTQRDDTLAGIYYKAALQATNDRGSRVKRGEIIQATLDPTYPPDIKIEAIHSQPKPKPTTEAGNVILGEILKHSVEDERGITEILTSPVPGFTYFLPNLGPGGSTLRIKSREFRAGISELVRLGWLYEPENGENTLRYEFKAE